MLMGDETHDGAVGQLAWACKPCVLDEHRSALASGGTRSARRARMTKPIPTLQKYMTTTPHAIGEDQTLKLAHEVMREHRIRHLPVLRGGKLVGLISQRDLALIETLQDVDPTKVTVDDAMSTEVFSADPSTPLDEVVGTMADKKYGCCVAMQNSKVVGIFTTVDACRALGELLHGRLAK
jgi:acetoin utilization protein AcuB